MGLAIFILCFLGADQLSKTYALKHLAGRIPQPVIPGFFDLTYVENRGAAWGLGHDRPWATIVITITSGLLTLGLLWLLKHLKHPWLRFSISLIIAGSLGNLCDRFLRGYVVDFLSFHFGSYNFPAFNIADSGVVVGSIMLAICLIFQPQAWQEFARSLGIEDQA